MTDSSYDARINAIARLTDQGLLETVAMRKVDFGLDQLDDALRRAARDRLRDVCLTAIAKLTDQAELAKMATGYDHLRDVTNEGDPANRATEYGDSQVRAAALAKLTDQILLKKIAMENENFDIRAAAIAKLTDQTVQKEATIAYQATLAKIASGDGDSVVRIAAIEKLADQTVLGNIAMAVKEEGDYGNYSAIRAAAVRRLTNEIVLENIAQGKIYPWKPSALLAAHFGESDNFRVAAIATLTNQTLLKQIAGTPDLPEDGVRAAFDGRALERFEADITKTNVLGAAARVRLALLDPKVVSLLPDALFIADCSTSVQGYYIRGTDKRAPPIYGERVTFTIRQGLRTLAKGTWSSRFPDAATTGGEFYGYILPKVDESDMLAHFFRNPEFTPSNGTKP